MDSITYIGLDAHITNYTICSFDGYEGTGGRADKQCLSLHTLNAEPALILDPSRRANCPRY